MWHMKGHMNTLIIIIAQLWSGNICLDANADGINTCNVGTLSRAWKCDKLPKIDLTDVANIFCTDAKGELVELTVKHLPPPTVPLPAPKSTKRVEPVPKCDTSKGEILTRSCDENEVCGPYRCEQGSLTVPQGTWPWGHMPPLGSIPLTTESKGKKGK